MSRIGNRLLTIPSGVTITEKDRVIEVKGKLGTLHVPLPEQIDVQIEDHHAAVKRPDDTKINKQNHGTVRALIKNAINGVTKGYEKKLEIVGIGYKATIQGDGTLLLNIGYSHPVVITPRPDVKITAPDATHVTVTGIDRQGVGETAANIRAVRRPEPYQGKGIKYAGEHIIRKEGKRAGKK